MVVVVGWAREPEGKLRPFKPRLLCFTEESLPALQGAQKRELLFRSEALEKGRHSRMRSQPSPLREQSRTVPSVVVPADPGSHPPSSARQNPNPLPRVCVRSGRAPSF